MKKRLLVVFTLITALLMLVACGKTEYTVTFDSDGGSAVAAVDVEENGLVTEPDAPTKEHCVFLGWYVNTAAEGEAENWKEWSFDSDVVTGDITLKAQWAPASYKVKFDTNGGNTIPQKTVTAGNPVARPLYDPQQLNYRFDGWFDEDGNEWNFEENLIYGETTIYAHWTPYFDVMFDSAGGTHTVQQLILQGETVVKPADPTRDNYKFMGWSDGTKMWNFETDVIEGTTTLTAVWKRLWTVSFDTDGAGTINSIIVEDGELATAPTAPDKGEKYRLIGWYLGNDPWDFSADTVTGDITLKAKWIIQTPPTEI